MITPATAEPTARQHRGRSRYWHRHTDGGGSWRGASGPPGADLAAIRRGIGRDAGSVPGMWPFYTELRPDGALTHALRAEHIALTLFAVHQQSQRRPMHHAGTGVGAAARALRDSGKFSADAVDRRFAAAATASGISEAAFHLRGMITQLRSISQPVDYDLLLRDLRDWQDPARAASVRRRWGSQYFAPRPGAQEAAGPAGPGS